VSGARNHDVDSFRVSTVVTPFVLASTVSNRTATNEDVRNFPITPTSEIMRCELNHQNLDQQLPPSIVSWRESVELGYALDPVEANASCERDHGSRECGYCRRIGALSDGAGPTLKSCARCRAVEYCSRECQTSDWKERHKKLCGSYQQLSVDKTGNLVLKDTADKSLVKSAIFSKVRLYACPYAVHQSRSMGRGFVFVQSTATLATMALPSPFEMNGGPLREQRSLILHYLTLGEFDVEVCREDFELATLRPQLKDLVDSYQPEEELVILARFRCGHLAVGVASLVPEYNACVRLGREYFADHGTDPLQLDIDDA
jgi:MYND finger